MARKQQLFLFDPKTEESFNEMVKLFTDQGLIDVLHTTKQPNKSRLMRAIVNAVDLTAVEAELKKGVA